MHEYSLKWFADGLPPSKRYDTLWNGLLMDCKLQRNAWLFFEMVCWWFFYLYEIGLSLKWLGNGLPTLQRCMSLFWNGLLIVCPLERDITLSEIVCKWFSSFLALHQSFLKLFCWWFAHFKEIRLSGFLCLWFANFKEMLDSSLKWFADDLPTCMR